jgi:hypothetical protein
MTPNPTPAELLANDRLVNGDMGAAMNEIIFRLKSNINGVIALDNATRGWAGGLAMPEVIDVIVAPMDVTKKHKNLMLVAMRETTTAQGIGGTFTNDWACSVTVVGDAVTAPQQNLTMTRRRELVKTILFPYLSGAVNSAGQLCWRQMEPTDGELENDFEEGISQATQIFLVKQPPSYQG